MQLVEHLARAVGAVTVDRRIVVVFVVFAGQQVGDQLRGRLGVAGVARGDPGRGDDLAVRVDSDMALVPVEAAVVGLVPVPGLRIHGRDHPVRCHLPGDTHHAVRSGLQVLAQHRGQQLHSLRHHVRQLLPVQGGQQHVAIPGPGVHQRVPGRLVVPVDDRLARAGVVVATGKQRPQPRGQLGVGHTQQPTDRRADQRDRVHRGNRVVQRSGIQHSTPSQQSGLPGRVQRHVEDPVRAIRAAQPFPHVDQHGVREPDPVRRAVPATHHGRVVPPHIEGEPL